MKRTEGGENSVSHRSDSSCSGERTLRVHAGSHQVITRHPETAWKCGWHSGRKSDRPIFVVVFGGGGGGAKNIFTRRRSARDKRESEGQGEKNHCHIASLWGSATLRTGEERHTPAYTHAVKKTRAHTHSWEEHNVFTLKSSRLDGQRYLKIKEKEKQCVTKTISRWRRHFHEG